MIEILFERVVIVVLAFAFEICFARRNGLFTKIIHPIAIIGYIINFFETQFIDKGVKADLIIERSPRPTYQQIRFYQGVFVNLMVLLIVLLLYEIISSSLSVVFDSIKNADIFESNNNFFDKTIKYIFTAFFLSMFFGYFQLRDHVEQVAKILQADDYDKRQLSDELLNIVGRDTKDISKSDAYKAAIETLAENFSDAYIAPLLYYLLFGFEGILIYKTINTLDSCLGYKDYRYIYFGKFSAKLDDLVNLLPARLSVALLMISNFRFSFADYCQVAYFAKNHDSPNAGLLEACLAYLLKIELGGDRTYSDLDKQALATNNKKGNNRIGSGRKILLGKDLQAAVNITNRSFGLILLCFILMLAIIIIVY